MNKLEARVVTALAAMACVAVPVSDDSSGSYKRIRIGSSAQQRRQIEAIRSKRKSQRQAKKKGR